MKSIVWGGVDYPITQGFGENSPDVPDDWYAYAVDVGLPYGAHPGLDIGVPFGTKLFALTSGVVEQAGFAPYFRPNPVYIKTATGELHIYGHMWEDAVRQGQTVARGDYLGTSGQRTISGTMTPDGSGPHLHFEARNEWGKVFDPSQILQAGASDPTTGGTDTGGTPTGGTPTPAGDVSPTPGTESGGIGAPFTDMLGVYMGAVFSFLGQAFQRLGFGIVGIVLLGVGAVGLVGVDNVASAVPVGRVAKIVGKVA